MLSKEPLIVMMLVSAALLISGTTYANDRVEVDLWGTAPYISGGISLYHNSEAPTVSFPVVGLSLVPQITPVITGTDYDSNIVKYRELFVGIQPTVISVQESFVYLNLGYKGLFVTEEGKDFRTHRSIAIGIGSVIQLWENTGLDIGLDYQPVPRYGGLVSLRWGVRF